MAKRRIPKEVVLAANARSAIVATARAIVNGKVASSETERVLSRWLITLHGETLILSSTLQTMITIANLKSNHRTHLAESILKHSREFRKAPWNLKSLHKIKTLLEDKSRKKR